MVFYRYTLRVIFAVFILITTIPGLAQQNEKIDQLNAKGMRFLTTPDSLVVYASAAYQLSKSTNYAFGEGISSKLMGIYYHRKSDFKKAIASYENALRIFTEQNNQLEIAKAYLNIATTHSAQLEFVKSVDFGLKALKIFEQLNDPNGQGRVLNLLGTAASAGKDYTSAKRFFLRYSELVKKIKDTIEIATSYNNIGSTYSQLKRTDSALFYLKAAAALHEKKNNRKGMGTIFQNIGAIYDDKGDYVNAMRYFKESMRQYEAVGDRKWQSHSYYNIGAGYKKLKDTATAIKWFNKALEMASDVGEKEVIFKTNESLAAIRAGDNKYQMAYETLKLALNASDSILTTSKARIIEELQTKYETEKKEARIKVLHQESTIQKLEIKQRNVYLAVAVALLLLGGMFALLIMNRRKLRERARIQEAINRQQDIAARAVLDAEERERRRIAGDLHDGVGQLLSAALMNLNGLFSNLHLKGTDEIQATRTLALVNESYDEMRTISHQIMPNALLKAGLASAVKEFLGKLDQAKIKVSLETIGLNSRLSEQTETVLYRVIQETVTNVIKHAAATRLNIQLIKDSDGVSVNIEDNGKGFDKNRLKQSKGIGMSNVFSRVEFLKGSVDIDTAPGKGTLVAIHIPD